MSGLLVALAVCSAPLAIARPTTPKPPTTIVKLQATRTVRIIPDLFESTLRSQHRAESAADAQALVNNDIAAATAMARDVKGIVVTRLAPIMLGVLCGVVGACGRPSRLSR